MAIYTARISSRCALCRSLEEVRETHIKSSVRGELDGTAGETTSHLTGGTTGETTSHLTGGTTSHSTRLSKGDNQVAGYKAASCQVIGYSHSTKLANIASQVVGYVEGLNGAKH